MTLYITMGIIGAIAIFTILVSFRELGEEDDLEEML